MARVRAPSRELQATSVSGLLQPSDSPHSADAIAAGFVLLVGDAPLLLRALQRILQLDGHRVALAVTGSEFEEGLADVDLGVVLIDLAMRHVSGLDVLNRVKAERPEAEVVVMTGRVCVENAIRCLRRGAFDYVAKPFEDPQRVRVAVKRALERGRLVRRNRELESALATASGPGRVAVARPSPAAPDREPVAIESLNELPLSLDAYEKSALERALREVGGDARAAARALGMGRSTLYRKLAKYGLSARESASGSRGGRAPGLGAAGPIG